MSETMKEIESQIEKELSEKMDDYIMECILSAEGEKPNMAVIQKEAEIVENNFGYRSIYWRGKRVGGFCFSELEMSTTGIQPVLRSNFMFETVNP